jgi:hypothetical protein
MAAGGGMGDRLGNEAIKLLRRAAKNEKVQAAAVGGFIRSSQHDGVFVSAIGRRDGEGQAVSVVDAGEP